MKQKYPITNLQQPKFLHHKYVYLSRWLNLCWIKETLYKDTYYFRKQ